MRALLVDDRAALRSALRLMLENEANLEVVGEAGNLRPIALVVKDLHPDLLFVDWQMSGLETNRAREQFVNSVRAIDPDLYIIALTNDDTATTSLLFGADAYINRAEPPERILSVVQRATNRKLGSNGPRAEGYLRS